MRKFKKVVAIALAATMVMGMSLTAFADDNSGSSNGAGTSEGHVEKKATSVVLPTVSGTPFAYTMDPEGLIEETSHGKYGDAVEFPAKAGDTHVYWNNGAKGGDGADKDNIVYANTSKAQTVTNKSSHDISLTVSVTASSAETDIPLVAQSAIATAEAASLYLGLIVDGQAAETINTAAAATKSVTIDGNEDNFKIAVKSDNSGYEYRVLSLAEYKALEGNSSKTQDDFDATWDSADFQVEGAVTTGKAITSTTTAPTIAVTWSWVDPEEAAAEAAAAAQEAVTNFKSAHASVLALTTATVAGGEDEATAIAAAAEAFAALSDAAKAILAAEDTPINAAFFEALADASAAVVLDAAPSIETTSYTMAADTAIEVDVDLGVGSLAATGIASITYVKGSGATATLASDKYSFADGKLTFTAAYINSVLDAGVTSRAYTIKFNDSDNTEVVINLATE